VPRTGVPAAEGGCELILTATSESARTRLLLLDIEGTTTPIDFVHGTLFPFASAGVEKFLAQHGEEDGIRSLMDAFRGQREADAREHSGVPPWHEATARERVASAAAYVRWLIARDSKFTALKSLQGRIWELGYRRGELRGAVYPDVAPAFARWRAQGRRMAIFSSGSILAQKLLFAHSTAGDLSAFLDAFFDTSTGPKRGVESYRRIATAVGVSPAEVLFLSDVTAELDAAREAKMATVQALRPGVLEQGTTTHAGIHSFDEVFP
jgi:enolase-phosphatase E1